MIRVLISDDASNGPTIQTTLRETLRANAGDADLIGAIRSAWHRRDARKGRRVAHFYFGGGASPRLFITLHRFDLPTPTR